MDETPETEWQWFRRAIRDSLLFPRRFAASLAREHFGLAGALVGLLAGMCFSIATELLLIAGKGLDPLEHVARIVTDAVLLGLRLSIVAALMAAAVCAVSIVLRSRRIGIDQAFTALTFALTPVLIAPVLATVVAVAPGAFTAAAVIAVLLVLRLVYGLVENLRRFVPLAVAITATLVVIASVPLVLADQVQRVRFVGLGYAPELAPLLVAPQLAGPTYVFAGTDYELTLPVRWRSAPLGVPGQIGRFETASDVLIVLRISGDAFTTSDGFADIAGLPWRRGLVESGGRIFNFESSSRAVVRTRDLVMIDDVFRGSVDGTTELLRQFTGAAGTRGIALQFRYIRPESERAALDESAAIAASWHALGR
ncbi:MAG TPA: hypothetical protein VIM50_04545 [Candidatus Limnocylindria bacterium]